MKKRLLKVIATVVACLGLSAFAFAGCNKNNGNETSTGGNQTTGGGNTGGDSGNTGGDSGNTGGDSGNTGGDSGNTGGDSGNTGGDSGNTGGDSGNTGGDSGNTGGDSGNTGGDSGNTGGDSGNTGGDSGNTGGDSGNTGGDSGNTGGDSGNTEVKPPVITQPVEGGVEIITAKNGLESAYVTFKPVKNAVSYNVYYTKNGGSAVKLDAPLVRQYADYLRADAVGLAAGEYTMRVVPVDYQNNEVTASAGQASVTAIAHTREGYAFVGAESGKSASGAYNDDGTLRSNARVIYVTNDNKDTVKLNVIVDKTEVECVGVQNIILGYKKNKDTRPLAIRFIGNITDPANMPKGDLYVDTAKNGMTFEGIGNDATFNGFGLVLKGVSYVEVRNLGFMNCNSDEGDNVGLQQDDDHVWVHNCDMFYGDAGSDADQVKGDGALDTKKSHHVTHSYNHFWDNGKCNLQGGTSSDTSNYITYHHNWYDHSDSRHPRIRRATVHVYNNYFDGNAKYGIGSTTDSDVFAENNYFRSTTKMKPMMISKQGTDPLTAENASTFNEDGGIIKAYGNKFDCPADKLQFLAYGSTPTLALYNGLDTTKDFDAYVVEDRNATVPSTVTAKVGGATYNNFDTASDFYKYKADSADDAKKNVMKYAGRVDGGDFKFTFNNATEDGNSEVIPELKTRLTNYRDALVKVFGIEASGSGSTGGTTGGDSGNTGSGDSGNTGGDSGNTGGELPEGTSVILLNKGATYPAGVTVSGNYKDTNYTYNGSQYKPLKMESATSVSIALTEAKTLKLYIVDNEGKAIGGKKIKVDDSAYTSDANGFVEVSIASAKTVKITKGDSINLAYILIV